MIVREDLPGGAGLTAYLILAEKQASALDEIRNFLKEKLPGYMVPILCSLEKFPLTPNGKLDRRALPAPENTDSGDEEIIEELSDATERMLAGIWSDVLKVPQVSVYDNFFDLGGHSLLATQVVSRIEKDLGVRIKP